MNTTLKVLTLASLGFPLAASAASDGFEKKCPDIVQCAQSVGELLNQKYVFTEDVKGRLHSTRNVELTPENAELLFTSMLYAEGYARVPLGTSGAFQITRLRDAREIAFPFIRASKKEAPVLPATWDLITMEYAPDHPQLVEDMAKALREFMPNYSRIVAAKEMGRIVITDSALNLAKLYQILTALDEPRADGKR